MKVLIHFLCSSFVICSLIINYGCWFKDWARRKTVWWKKYLPNLLYEIIIILYKTGAIIALLGSIAVYILVAKKYL
jgi:hypothetical protein